MQKFLFPFLAIFLILASGIYYLVSVHADDTCNPDRFSDPNDPILLKCLADFNNSLTLSINATKPLEGQLTALKTQLAQIQSSLDNISASIKNKQKELNVREDKLALQQALLEKRVKAYYIRSYLTEPLLVILSSVQAGDLFRELSYRQSVTRQDRQIISSITQEVVGLLTQKEKLEKDKVRLASLQAEVDKNASFLGGEIKKAKAYQSDLSSQIAQLTAKQEEILASRLAGLNIPRSAYTLQGGCIDDRPIDPGFSPRFAFFTYGVPNRVGLNQYGAKGRAEAGQDYLSILKAYYNFDNIGTAGTNIQIRVDGFSSYSLEDYMKRIYEMPDSFPMEALKAQAIAARSYALAYTNNGQGSICATQSCQVFQPNDKGGSWDAAVDATKGQVMVQGGSPIKAWFSSTHGGYVFSSGDIGWSGTSFTKHATDTTTASAGSFSDLASSAYDRASPWFYCDWGSRAQYNKTAWLKSDEIADIVNVLLLAQHDSSVRDHLYQPDKGNPAGTDTWDAVRVKDELRSRGGTAFDSVSSVSIGADFSSGRTTSVNISGSGGSASFSGTDFKTYFNLRAPANIQIVGPLYNIEMK